MARGYNVCSLDDYICTCCGNINSSFDKLGNLQSKYSVKSVYCPICKSETESIKLGDSSLVKAELLGMNDLNDIEHEVMDLLNNEHRKTR